jgi:putative MATE family efflux protein
MENYKQLENERVSKLLLRFSIPAIVGMLVNALYNVVDRIFVGNSVGTLGIAGITVGFPLMLLMMAFTMLIGLGANSLVSIRLGEKKKEEAELILGNAIVLLIIVSLAFTVAGLVFLNPLMRFFGASRQVLPYANAYMQIILVGTVFQGIGFGMNNFIRGEGNPKTAMLTMIIGAVLNAILCPVFIFGLRMGIRGSALATVLSWTVSALWVTGYFFFGKSSVKIRRHNLKLDRQTVLQIIMLGLAPFSLQVAAGLVSVIFNKSLVYYGGDIAISGMGIIISIFTVILMPLLGINQGMQPIIGFNYGARRYDRVKEAFKLAIMAATALVTFGFLMIEIFPKQIVGIFNSSDPELLEFTTWALRVFLIFLPVVGFQIVSANYFQAVGKPKQAAFLSLSRQLLFLIPTVLILPLFFSLHGVIMAGPVADLASSVLTGIWIYRELKHLEDRHRSTVSVES